MRHEDVPRDGTIDELQKDLSKKVSYMHRRAREELGGMVDFPENWRETPVPFIPIKRDMETFFSIARALHEEGIFVATCAPPANRVIWYPCNCPMKLNRVCN